MPGPHLWRWKESFVLIFSAEKKIMLKFEYFWKCAPEVYSGSRVFRFLNTKLTTTMCGRPKWDGTWKRAVDAYTLTSQILQCRFSMTCRWTVLSNGVRCRSPRANLSNTALSAGLTEHARICTTTWMTRINDMTFTARQGQPSTSTSSYTSNCMSRWCSG